jgi:hypothetical protein
MASLTVKTLPLQQPGNSLAVWLAGHHPDLFLTVFKQAKSAQVAKKIQLRGLGQDDGGTTTFFGDSSDVTLSPVTIDQTAIETLPSNLLTDSNSSGAGFLSNLGNSLTSSGSTIGTVLASAGSGVLGALGSVGTYLTSPTGLSNLSSLAKTYYAAQGATAQAQTQQAVLQTQIARATVGQTAAPITFTTNPAGQLVPVYGNTAQPLTNQALASLAPSSLSVLLSQYGIYVALGAILLVGVALKRR